MKRVLSIDFDYFINATYQEREEMFIQGVDHLNPEILKKEWERCYDKHTRLVLMGATKEYMPFVNELGILVWNSKVKNGEPVVQIADSHSKIEQIFKDIPKDVEVELTHIDYHHDYYCMYSGDHTTCANWVRVQKELRGNNLKVEWIKRRDSEIDCFGGMPDFDKVTTDKITLADSYDYIFICFSPEWTPPHLKQTFMMLLNAVI